MKRWISLALLLCFLTGCGSQAKDTATVFAMDTVMTLTAYGAKGADGIDAAKTEISRIDALLSVSSETGDIYRLNRDGSATVSDEVFSLISKAVEISERTDGAFDPTVYPLMVAWGFTTEDYRVPGDSEIASLLEKVGTDKITMADDTVTLPDGGGIDLGGIGKGYTSDRVISVMKDAGVSSAIVSLGGNVACLGLKPDGSKWTVGLEDPAGGSDYIATISLGEKGKSLCAITSGAYERYFVQDGVTYHHILDPKTGKPADSDLKSVTIVTESGTLADGLSTALFVKGFDGAVEFWRENSDEFGMVLVTDDGIFATPDVAITSDQTVTTLEEAA